jgi:hypothetical protein
MTQNAKIARLPSHIRHPPVTHPDRPAQYRNRTDQETGWVSYGKLRKVMEGYGNFPASAASVGQSRSNPVKPRFLCFLRRNLSRRSQAKADPQCPIVPNQA